MLYLRCHDMCIGLNAGPARYESVEATLDLKQIVAKEGRLLHFELGHCAHATRIKRVGRVIKRQSTLVWRAARNCERKATVLSPVSSQSLDYTLHEDQCIANQGGSRKDISGNPKPCALDKLAVEPITEGKNRTAYKFGFKEDIATGGWTFCFTIIGTCANFRACCNNTLWRCETTRYRVQQLYTASGRSFKINKSAPANEGFRYCRKFLYKSA